MGVKLLYISSTQRYNYNNTNSNDFYIPCADSVYGSYKLKSISVPNTIYTIDAGVNDTFYVNVYNPASLALINTYLIDVSSLYISDGTTLATVIQTAINGTVSAPYNIFTVGYDDLNSKLTFSNLTYPFSLDLSSNYSSPINSILGFGKGIFNSTPFTAGSAGPFNVVSPYIVNLTRTPTIFITIEQANNYLQSLRSGMKYTFMIPNNVNSLYFIDSFFDQTAIFNQFAKELHITLRDEDNRIVNIQNVDWYMVLESTC